MHPQTKNIMMRNLRNFLNSGRGGLQEHQTEALEQAESFLRIQVGAPIFSEDQIKDNPEKQGNKKGDFFEVVSATGTGKTRMFGTMAKAMDVPTLIVTPRNILNKQTKKEFCEDIGIPESDIAVYDGKQSAAERKRVVEGNPPPQYVITSYQSLPSLLQRHELDVTNPKDVHYRPLVILDEVHEAQGDKTLQTLQKLKNNVLVAGFTATDAGVSETLFEGQKPIYHLPLAEAIERGILCHGIRTGSIDVTIDEGWIHNFLSTPRGSEYSREDVEKFARSPSVIEAAVRFHMMHDDEQLGRISRLPTIFYTEGVAAAREGAEAFNKKAVEMGIDAKAAYVSGGMKPSEYLPILEKFKRGEIQAIWNDSLLGMGFDAKNATVCYSLKPTRMPHVIEQQLGRVARKQGEDYQEKYGQDKVALAINVCGKDMNPVLFGEILGGQPSIYRRDYTHVQTPIRGEIERSDGLRLYLPEGVEVHIGYSDMQAILSKSIQSHEYLPLKTDEWIGMVDMVSRSPRSWKSISPIYHSLKSAWESAKDKGETTFTADGITLPVSKAGMFRGGSKITFCLHEDAIPSFQLTPERTPEWLGSTEMAIRMHRGFKIISHLYLELEAAWKTATESGQATFSAEGITLPVNQAGMFRGGSKVNFCLHESASKHFSGSQKKQVNGSA